MTRSDGGVILGDAREVLPLVGEGSVDLVLTDPPYGINANDGGDLIHRFEQAKGLRPGYTPKARPIANDGPEAHELFRQVLPEFKRVLRAGGWVCCCCAGGGPGTEFARWSLWLAEHLQFQQMVVFDKGPMGMGWRYRRSYEVVLTATKPGARPAWYDTTSRIENIIRPGDYGIRKVIPSADEHPFAKPEELAALFIRLHTKPGDTVLDPFCGSGWVGAACRRMGRKFIGVEIDPHWRSMAQARLDRVTPGLWEG